MYAYIYFYTYQLTTKLNGVWLNLLLISVFRKKIFVLVNMFYILLNYLIIEVTEEVYFTIVV